MTRKENLLRAIQHNNPEWVPNGLEDSVRIMPPVVERPSRAGLDDFGVRWDYDEAAEGGTYPAMGGHPIKSIDQWESQLQIPDPWSMDWSAAKAAADAVDRDVSIVEGFIEMGLFERSYLLLGMEDALIEYMMNPDEMERMVARIADYKIEFVSAFYEAAKPDMIWYGDDWGTQTGLFLPPDIWRRIIRTHTQRIYDRVIELGMMMNQHSCGKIDCLVQDMVEMGAAMWNPCQPCNDLAQIKKDFAGKIAFHGGIDSQFVLDRPGVTPEEVRAEVRLRIDQMGAGGGYVAGPSHSVPYDEALIAAMDDEIARYGQYPLAVER